MYFFIKINFFAYFQILCFLLILLVESSSLLSLSSPLSPRPFSLDHTKPVELNSLNRVPRFVQISFNNDPPKYSGYPYFFGRYISPVPRGKRTQDGKEYKDEKTTKSFFSFLFGR